MLLDYIFEVFLDGLTPGTSTRDLLAPVIEIEVLLVIPTLPPSTLPP